ncbi:unnamed protein product [Lymnaea stagnalis]|uniref:Uncharacterized protein n=1 Tax=Lymnaea stagnalis TaxID=6523 RepID=A0AAV2HZ87_LYMST
MTVNYMGRISILDRGDAPAQAVIDRNARSLAQRVADETRDELNKVMTRVQNIYGAMDIVDDTYLSPSMEYVNDLSELEAILKDEIKKRQYQQQVTVFIVGYSDICHQKLRLLQQVNEFFMENCKNIDEEDWFPTTPDMDLDEVSNTVEDSLNHAHELTKRLAELNKDMIKYMGAAAEKKASNKGRKKIEKALQQAKEDVSGLSEKLLHLQKELEDREEKVHVMVKQMESKNLEVQKFRTAAELAKAAAGEINALHKEIALREAKIISQRQQISKLEVELTETNHIKEKSLTKLSFSDEESQQKIVLLQKELDEQKKQNEDVRKEMTKHLDHQISVLHESHRQAIEDLKTQHESETKQMQGFVVAPLPSGDVAKTTEAESTQQPPETSDVKQPSRSRKGRAKRHLRKQRNAESQPDIKEPKGKSLSSGDKKPGKNVTKSPTRTKGEVRQGM